jgi:DeoR/GlpR family transcriptional regulator of sugar metabolism
MRQWTGMATDAQLLGEERREAIVRRLRTEGKVRAAALAQDFSVSLDTVRRDLAELADAGLLRRVHGGALPPTAPGPPEFEARVGLNLASKRAVAEAAASLVADGDVLALTGGSTMLELARRLPDGLEATFVVTSPDIASALAEHPGVRHLKIADASGKRLGRSFGVKLWPTLVFLKDGKEIARLVRPRDAAAIGEALARISARQ